MNCYFDNTRINKLTGMHEMMLLEVRELRKTFGTNIALEGSFTGVRPQMYFEIRQLTEGFAANVAFVMHLAVLLLERIRQRSIAPRALRVRAEGTALGATMIVWRQ